ncbi:hypothetical protein XA68_15720 [Ophiocordyceps unilateralis]|uniref:Ribosomal RNA-processing protein 17 n=1 Tax=Ophiocordyceps unilateralis TaxID=268505 RepID=A0A2A9PKR8_OPHUN|nr:hypothetical protein XA68_15720 [Ophiocordyceps unilateralis]
MFAKPRQKKTSLLPPLGSKKRKLKSSIEEVLFDDDARREYLTGFHKRKQQRIKRAQELAAQRAHQDKLDARKQMRTERRREVEQHVETVNRMLRECGAVTDPVEMASDEWDGFPDKPNLDTVGHEEEYIDEDRYTTVTVETVTISRDGLDTAQTSLGKEDEDEEAEAEVGRQPEADTKTRKTGLRPSRTKKKKFRYESKAEKLIGGGGKKRSRRQR